MIDFRTRSSDIEIMDDLNCDGAVVDQTLRELEFINKWLGGNAVTFEGVRSLLRNHTSGIISIADLGCGSGEMLKLVARWGRKNKLTMNLVGIDANPHIVEFAKSNCRDYPEISFEVLNIFSPEFLSRKYDVVMGTLFYHHFSEDELVPFFANLKDQVHVGIIINDIHRHPLAYHSIKILTSLFSKSSMVRFDAPLSVLRAFTRNELQAILHRAGLKNYRLKWRWAFRWLALYSKATASSK